MDKNSITSQKTGTLIFNSNSLDFANKEAINFCSEIFNLSKLKTFTQSLKELQKCPDFFYVSAKLYDKKTIPIEKIRETLSKINYAPLLNSKKIVFIENANDLSIESQNTILKSLEEPPDHTFFVLSTNSLSSLLPTVRSRAINIELNSKTLTEDIEVLPESLEGKFDEVDKISKISDVTRKREKAYALFDFFFQQIQKEKPNVKYKKMRNLINFRRAIDKNANLRLVLENAIIEVYT